MKKNKSKIPSLMLMIVIAKLIGMLRDVVLARYFGTSYISDAYLIASSIPTVLFFFIGNSISTAYIPVYNKIRFAEGEYKAQCFSNNLINVMMIICSMLAAFLLICPQIAVKLFAAGFDNATNVLASSLIRISAVSVYIMLLISVFTGYLQANNNFIVPAAISLPRNIILMLSVSLAYYINLELLGWGLLVAYISEFVLMLPFILKKKYCYKFHIDFKDKYLKDTLYIIAPILLGTSVSRLNKIIDKSIASTIIEGGISALSYASIINHAIQEILITGVITVLFASCSVLVSKGEDEKVKKKLNITIDCMSVILFPAVVGIIVLSKLIVNTILGGGSFDLQSLTLTSGALCFYTLGLPFLAFRDALIKVFYAYKQTKVTTMASIISIIVNIIFNLILSKFMGINGLALATTFSSAVNCIILYISLYKKIGDFGFRGTIVTILKSVISSVIMGAVLLFIKPYISTIINIDILYLILLVIIGIGIYTFVGLILKIEPLITIIRKFRVISLKNKKRW